MFLKQLAAQESDHVSGLLCGIAGGLQMGSRGGGPRERKREARALARLRLHPEGASMPVHDFLAGGQPNSRSRIFFAVQAFEDAENLRLIFRWNSDAVVFHGKNPVARSFRRRDRNARWLFGTVFQRIAD